MEIIIHGDKLKVTDAMKEYIDCVDSGYDYSEPMTSIDFKEN